jgi:hypothetical protein
VGFQIAALLHALFERGNLIFVDEHCHVADVGEIDEGHEIGRACDTVVAVRCQIAERRSEQRAAEAITDGVYAGLAGCGVDRVERRERPLEHVVLEAALVQTLEVEPSRGLEVTADHVARTAFQISGPVLS